MTSSPRLLFIITILIALVASCNRSSGAQERILEFPQDHSLGTLWILEESSSFLSVFPEVEKGEAKGVVRVAVPDGWLLELRVSSTVATYLSGLSRLKPDDLWGIFFYETQVADDDLSHLKLLTGLRFLDLSSLEITGG